MTGGAGSGRPFSVVAFLGTQVLGDFIEYHLLAASVARSVAGARLLVVYRDDRPYKNFVTLLNPAVTSTLKVPADTANVVPLDWFDGRADVPGRPLGPEFYANRFHDPDVFLTPSMMGLHLARRLGPPPALRIPAPMAPGLAAALEAAGVRPDRWFATLHMRESGYAFRRGVSSMRDVDPTTYVDMVRRIVNTHGGQVVRLGDPSMTPLPPMEGLVDLSRIDGTFPLQAFAVSRSRFLVGTASGPLALGCGFRVPTAITNAIHFSLWRDGDAVMGQRDICLGDGPPMDFRRYTKALGGMPLAPRGLTSVPNTPAELCGAADHMVAATAGCDGWRTPGDDENQDGTSEIVRLPLPRRRNGEGFEFTWL